MEETKTAIEAAKEAGKLLKERFLDEQTIHVKEGQGIVTEADLEAERLIIETLKRDYPSYSILSEEDGMNKQDSPYMWVIDPLDGTTNYSIKNPFFCVSIGLAEKKEQGWKVIAGTVVAPITGEVFFAEAGEGAFVNGEPMRVASGDDLKKLIIGFCDGHGERGAERSIQLFTQMKPHMRSFTQMRAAALELAYVAAGRLGGFVFIDGKSWDMAAGQLLVTEAGGQVSDFKGSPWVLGNGDILATNGHIHPQLLDITKGV